MTNRLVDNIDKHLAKGDTKLKKHKPRPLTIEEIKRLKDSLYVALDEAEISRRGVLSHFNVKIADKKWESFEAADNEVQLLFNEFYVKDQERRFKEKEPEQKGKKIINTPEEGAEAIKILKNKPLEWIDKKLPHMIVGEEKNRKLLFISKSTYFCDNPTSEGIKGRSAVGKSWLINHILECFPEEDVYIKSRITPAWLDRTTDELKHKILVIQQMSGFQTAEDNLHVMLTEHKLTLSTVDKSGEAHDIEVEGPLSFTFTTTWVSINPQMETRTFELQIDDSPEQTAKIQKYQMKLDKHPWLKKEGLKKLHEIRPVIRWLRDNGIKKVVVPFSDLLEFPTNRHILRRQRPQIMELIKQTARINQLTRYVIERGEERYIVADYDDVKYVLNNFTDIFQTSFGGVSPDEMEVLRKLETDLTETNRVWFTAYDASEFYGKASSTTRFWLNDLEKKGLVRLVMEGKGRGKTNRYALNLPKENDKMFKFIFNNLTQANCRKKLVEFLDFNIDITCVRGLYTTEKVRKKVRFKLPDGRFVP